MAGKTKSVAVKKTATKKTTTKRQNKSSSRQTTFSDYFRFGESYTSLVLGIIVVIFASLLLVTFFRSRGTDNAIVTQDTSSISTSRNESEDISTGGEKTYTIQKGDDLWKIAEAQYSNGYNWVEIARANKISNPNVINVGSKIVIPNIQKPTDKSNIAVTITAKPTNVKPSLTLTPVPSATLTPAPTKVLPTKIEATPTVIVKPTISPTGEPTHTSPKLTGSSYIVISGDNLWEIAERAYLDGYKWVDIARANKLTNPDLIYPGTKLTLPR